MARDYMETLLEVVEEVAADEREFNRAKIVSQRLLDCFQGESFSIILAALYLNVIAMIDCVEMKCHSKQLKN